MAVVLTVRSSASSSTIFAVCGINSLTHIPLLPCCWKLNIDGATASLD